MPGGKVFFVHDSSCVQAQDRGHSAIVTIEQLLKAGTHAEKSQVLDVTRMYIEKMAESELADAHSDMFGQLQNTLAALHYPPLITDN